MAYEELSFGYDELMTDVRYPALADFIHCSLMKAGIEQGILLDLACGTGTLSYLMAERGYEVIGVDLSEEMLAIAANKQTPDRKGIPPVFIRQDMRELDLYGTVDACICMLDSLNYILSPEDLSEVFRRVALFLNPGGLFLFDINTPEKLARMDGAAYTDEDDEHGLFCVWKTALTDVPRTYQYVVDVFTRRNIPKTGEVWRRGTEEHLVYAHEPLDILSTALRNGFTSIKPYGEHVLDQRDPEEFAFGSSENRLYFICTKSR